ncbi:EAL domain-containing protein [Pelagerythrobacter marensis]|uniref:EAL domain-containing protein n=1 Tax=Pelagerythrobacter marensis TaxID=543877 RepID=A0ABZ2D668_9SPHN
MDAREPAVAPGGDERRVGGDRREIKRAKVSAVAKPPPVLPVPFFWMSLAVAIAFALSGVVALSGPPLVSAAAAIASVAFAALGRSVNAWGERVELAPAARRVLAVALVALSSAGAGFGLADWMYSGTLDWRIGVAALVTVNVLFAALLSDRIVLVFVSKLGCWAPVAVVDGSFYAYSGLTMAAIASALVASYQARFERTRAEEEEALARVRDRAQSILNDYEETGQGWFWETDRRGRLTYLSSSVARSLGRTEEELIGRSFSRLFDLGDENREGERTLTFHLSSRSSFEGLAVKAAAADHERWWSINGRPVYDGFRNFCGFRGSGTDLTEKKLSEENAKRLARYDSLTGLANRFQMSQTLEKIVCSPQERERECAILLLDLDRFKHVNDTMGHPAGDALLKQVAQRLERTAGKFGRVGRLGGDEFEVIVPGRSDRDKLGHLAQEILHALSQPYTIEGQRVVIGSSIGIAISPDHGVTSESLIRNADLALYAAKDGGRGRFHFYSNDLHTAAEERNALERDLRDAIAQGGLELFYQPVVDASTERIAGFEALLRWNHPRRGWLSPAKFVPIAEDTGLITAIGEWAIRTACGALARWPEEVRCAVNVSPLQFASPQLPAIITNAIAQAGIDPSRLELEITESVFLNDDEGTEAMFAALKRIGVRLALDDFGTGYSSLGYLKKAPFDKIKIDQSFVSGATRPGSRNGAIIASITSLAQALGMDVTAEGVETLDELDLVRLHGCTHVQGYIYSKALSDNAVEQCLSDGLTMKAVGPRSARARRKTMLRKVVLDHDGHRYPGTIRNASHEGAMIEGLWNVPEGTRFRIALTETLSVGATTRWCIDNRMGVQFDRPVPLDIDGVPPVQDRQHSAGRD